MKQVDAKLIVCGEGNFYAQAVALAKEHGLEEKVIFKGYIPPAQLGEYTRSATVGITLFEDTSLSNRLSLANRFFDYMHAGVPQLCNKYAEYEVVNSRFEVACLVPDLTPDAIAAALNKLLTDNTYYNRLQQNCLAAREVYCWQEEEKKRPKESHQDEGQGGRDPTQGFHFWINEMIKILILIWRTLRTISMPSFKGLMRLPS